MSRHRAFVVNYAMPGRRSCAILVEEPVPGTPDNPRKQSILALTTLPADMHDESWGARSFRKGLVDISIMYNDVSVQLMKKKKVGLGLQFLDQVLSNRFRS